jgi:hypothetical protein
VLFINPCISQSKTDYQLATKAYDYLKKSNIVNGVSIGLGIASNIEMIAIGGFPLEVDDGVNAPLNISHAFLGTGRFVFSIFPPIGVSKARKMLQPWRGSPEKAASCKKLFATMDAAQILTAAAPVLVFSGGALMFYASTTMDYHYEYFDQCPYYSESYTMGKPELKTIGWILVGAGMAASLSSAVLIGISKKELSNKIGTLRIAAGPNGVGLKYNLPGQR